MKLLFHTGLAAFLVGVSVSVDAGLTHRYRLDETFQHEPVADSVGTMDASSTELRRGRAGVQAGAMQFAEVDGDSLDLGTSDLLLPAGDFTISLWVKFSNDGFDNNERLVDCSDGDAFSAMSSGFNLKTQNGTLRVFAGDGINKVASNPSNSGLVSNQWQLVALRYQASSNPGTANDGVVKVTAIPFTPAAVSALNVSSLTDGASHQVGAVGTATHLMVGVPSGTVATELLAFDGEMDDIRIYDAFLSDSELAELYNENLAVASSLRWIFNVNGDQEDWTASGAVTDEVTLGDYIVTSAGGVTAVESPDNLNLDLLGIQTVFLKLKNGSSSTNALITFQTLENPDYAGNAVLFPMVGTDPGYTLYEIDMTGHSNWKGTLKRLKVEVSSMTAGEELRFDRIAVGESGNRPNVIVMMADDLGWRDVTVNGSEYYQTPNVERLAAMGMNFPNAYAANPLCSPTRASVLTGLYPARVRVNTPAGHSATVTLDPTVPTTGNSYHPSTTVGSRTRLPNAYVTYAELMKKVGYSTAFLGKWHLGKDEYVPDNQGFDFVIGGRQHSGPPGGYFAPFSADSNIPSTWPDGTPVATDDHVNDILAAWAADFIEENRNQPFLINMWWYDVHGPFQAKPDVRANYIGQSDPEGRQNSPTYAAMIEVMDDGIGAVLDQLEVLGLRDDTVIFFTGDNGGWMYTWIAEDLAIPTDNYPSRAGKACIWDGGTHVPFIVTWPGQVAGGTVNSNNVNNMDIYATIVDMLDLQPYDGYPLDSTTLVPSLLGQTPANGNLLFNQFPQATPATGTFPAVWVRQGDMKLIRFYHGNGGAGNHRYELYNIAMDPGEENNVADEYPALVASLDALIEQHLIDTESLQPNANPNYIPPVFDQWTPNYGVWVQEGTSGRIKMVSNSFLPALDSPDLSALPAPEKVRVTMTSRSYGNGRIWWKFPGDADWLQAQSVGFGVTHDNVERTIDIPINPGASVAQIRYQPSSGYFQTEVLSIQVLDANGAAIETMSMLGVNDDADGDGLSDLDEVLAGRDPTDAADLGFEFNTAGNSEGWNPNNIANAIVANGSIAGLTTSADAQLSNTDFGFSANSVPDIYVKLKAGQNGSVQLFWGTAAADGYAAARRLDLQYTGAGDWQAIHLPVSSSAKASEWNNKTITRIRIDPIGKDATNFEIDWIRATDGDRDNDTLADTNEGFPYRDSDGDGMEDWADKDSDNDSASDWAETMAGRDPYNAVESGLDVDGDGYSDLFEIIAGTDPDSSINHLAETYGYVSQTNSTVAISVGLNGRDGRNYKLWHASSLLEADWALMAETNAVLNERFNFQNEVTGSNGFVRLDIRWDEQWQ